MSCQCETPFDSVESAQNTWRFWSKSSLTGNERSQSIFLLNRGRGGVAGRPFRAREL
jgi:hypothetical protein